MKTKTNLLLAIFIASSSLLFAKSPMPGPGCNFLFFTSNPYLGVRTGERVDFYQYKQDTGWSVIADYIDLPKKTDELFMTSGGLLGVRSGNNLTFYYVAIFFMLEPVDSLNFEIPGQVDELIFSGGGDLGVRCGKEVKFYYYDKGWKHYEQFDYTFPEDDIDEMILTSTNLLGVRRGHVLQFYDIVNQYNPVDMGHYLFADDVDELLITGGGELAVKIGKDVKFYNYTDKWEYLPQLEFQIKK